MEASADQMYEVARQMFDSFLDNPKMVQTARKTNSILRYTFTGPTVKITVNNRSDPVEVIYGECDVTPDVTISMDWSVAHEFLMGRANAADLFLKKKISVHPMSQAPRYMRLVPMFMSLLKRYPEIIEEMGLASEFDEA